MNNAPTSSIARQLELTISALARSTRKAIRTADKEAPTGTGGPWEVVEHRLQLLQTMLNVVAEFDKATAPTPAPAAEEVIEEDVVAQEVAPASPAVPKPALPAVPPSNSVPTVTNTTSTMLRRGDTWVAAA